MKIKKVEKPWGHEEWWAHTSNYVGKFLHVNAGHRLSLQYHEKKEESMYVLHGEVLFTLNDKEFTLRQGDTVHVPPNTIHRVKAITDAVLVEVSTPEVDDVVRVQDDYTRSE